VSAQSMEALQHANRVRLGQVAVKRALKAAELSIEAALSDPRAQRMSVYDLLMAQWGWGDSRAYRLLRGLHWHRPPVVVSLHRRVGALSERERAAIVQACKETRR
jgi:hypothetical protein